MLSISHSIFATISIYRDTLGSVNTRFLRLTFSCTSCNSVTLPRAGYVVNRGESAMVTAGCFKVLNSCEIEAAYVDLVKRRLCQDHELSGAPNGEVTKNSTWSMVRNEQR